jgi:hypothetical protein
MSLNTPPDVPKSILDETLPINPKFVEYDQRTNKAWVKADFEKCINCQWQNPLNSKTCERCGRTYFETYRKEEEISFQGDGVSAHTRTPVTECKVKARGPGGKMIAHKLNMKQRLVVSHQNKETHKENYCATCNRVYTWQDGRAATDEELATLPEKDTKHTVNFV